MTHQPATRHAPDIWRRYRDGHHINPDTWADARTRGAPVGTCRAGPPARAQCGGYLMPGDPYGTRPMYPTTCATCGHETAAPGPPARKASR